jgi:hypothetical protein
MSGHNKLKQKGMSRKDYLENNKKKGKTGHKKDWSKSPWKDPIPSELRGGGRH